MYKKIEDSSYYRWYMPYCLRQTAPNRYVILNRHYKPLGLITKDFIKYELYDVEMKMTPKRASRLSCHGSEDLDSIYLYDDGSNPTDGKKEMDNYLKKLAVLAKLKLKCEFPSNYQPIQS